MKTKKIFGRLLLLLCIANLTACSDKEEKERDQTKQIYPLTFEKNSYEIPKNISMKIHAKSCNGYNVLDLEVENESLLKAQVYIMENGTSSSTGWIHLTGLEKGKTKLTIYDRIAKEHTELTITIGDPYLGMQIKGTNHPLFLKQRDGFLFLIDNEPKEFYLFAQKEQQPTEKIEQKGTYAFSLENNIPYLTLSTVDHEEIKSSYKFNLSESQKNAFELLEFVFHLGWKQSRPSSTTREFNKTPYLILKEEHTDCEVVLAISSMTQMPQGILK